MPFVRRACFNSGIAVSSTAIFKAARLHWAIGLLIPLVAACVLAADPETPGAQPQTTTSGAFKQDALWGSAQTNRLRIGAYLDYVYVGPGDVHYSGVNDQESAAQSVSLNATAELPINDRWFVPLGLGSDNLFMESVEGAPIPDQVHTLRLNTGLGYRFNDDWTISGSLGPVLYRFEDIASNDIGVGGMVRASYRASPDLNVSFGLAFNPDSDIPVFPAAGVRWIVRTNLTLNLMVPKPGVIYRATPKLNLFVGGSIGGATFRSSDTLGTQIGQPRFNHELASYWDVRATVGADYQLTRLFAASLECGYSIWRALDYKDLDETVRFGPAPCVQAGLRCRF